MVAPASCRNLSIGFSQPLSQVTEPHDWVHSSAIDLKLPNMILSAQSNKFKLTYRLCNLAMLPSDYAKNVAAGVREEKKPSALAFCVAFKS